MQKLLSIITGLLALLLLAGCNDPMQEALDRGETFDFTSPAITITGKDVRVFVGDQAWTKNRKDEPLRMVYIKYLNSANTLTAEAIYGVPQEVYDSLEIEVTEGDLGDRYLTLEELYTKRGKVIDMIVDPNSRLWWVVIEEDNQANFYLVGWKTFYYHLDRGMTLPLKP